MAKPVWDDVHGWLDPDTGEPVPGGPDSAPADGSSTTGRAGTTLNNTGPEIYGPKNSTIPPGKQLGPWTNPSTWNNPFTHSSGVPLDNAPKGSGLNLRGLLGLLGGGNPYWRAGIAGAGVMEPTPAETGEFHPNVRPDIALGGKPTGVPFYDPLKDKPTGVPFYDPLKDKPTGLPVGTGPGRAPSGPVAAPVAAPIVSPAAAAPSAVAAQRPNLGYYMFDRPNMPAGQQGGRGGPTQTQMGMFGFDPNGPFLGRGGPSNAPAAAAQNVSAAAPAGALAANAPWNYGPTQQGRSFPQGPNLPPGGRQMNPTQVAAAVRTPNWWDSLLRGST